MPFPYGSSHHVCSCCWIYFVVIRWFLFTVLLCIAIVVVDYLVRLFCCICCCRYAIILPIVDLFIPTIFCCYKPFTLRYVCSFTVPHTLCIHVITTLYRVVLPPSLRFPHVVLVAFCCTVLWYICVPFYPFPVLICWLLYTLPIHYHYRCLTMRSGSSPITLPPVVFVPTFLALLLRLLHHVVCVSRAWRSPFLVLFYLFHYAHYQFWSCTGVLPHVLHTTTAHMPLFPHHPFCAVRTVLCRCHSVPPPPHAFPTDRLLDFRWVRSSTGLFLIFIFPYVCRLLYHYATIFPYRLYLTLPVLVWLWFRLQFYGYSAARLLPWCRLPHHCMPRTFCLVCGSGLLPNYRCTLSPVTPTLYAALLFWLDLLVMYYTPWFVITDTFIRFDVACSVRLVTLFIYSVRTVVLYTYRYYHLTCVVPLLIPVWTIAFVILPALRAQWFLQFYVPLITFHVEFTCGSAFCPLVVSFYCTCCVYGYTTPPGPYRNPHHTRIYPPHLVSLLRFTVPDVVRIIIILPFCLRLLRSAPFTVFAFALFVILYVRTLPMRSLTVYHPIGFAFACGSRLFHCTFTFTTSLPALLLLLLRSPVLLFVPKRSAVGSGSIAFTTCTVRCLPGFILPSFVHRRPFHFVYQFLGYVVRCYSSTTVIIITVLMPFTAVGSPAWLRPPPLVPCHRSPPTHTTRGLLHYARRSSRSYPFLTLRYVLRSYAPCRWVAFTFWFVRHRWLFHSLPHPPVTFPVRSHLPPWFHAIYAVSSYTFILIFISSTFISLFLFSSACTAIWFVVPSFFSWIVPV